MPQTFNSNEEVKTEEVDARPYQLLATMIDQGRSFSGHERNHFFLNLRDGTFADTSAISGLDFPDDARAVASVDWDHDGDLDLWISNRNAPRLRLLRNNQQTTLNDHLSLRLIGNGQNSNRDAIGARVTIQLSNDPSKPITRSLRAGEGFLTQHSKWLHFGLGPNAKLASVTVRWPNGTTEVFDNITTNARHFLTQGSGSARLVPKRPPRTTLTSSENPVIQSGSQARIPLITLEQAPTLNIQDPDGSLVRIGGGKPVLLNLWSTWCNACHEELKQFAAQEQTYRDAGIDVITLCVDASDNPSPSPEAVIANTKSPFASAAADPRLLNDLQALHDRSVGLNRPLPLPSSFLIDAKGQFSVIYKGPVSAQQIISDLLHSTLSPQQRKLLASPLPGTQLPPLAPINNQ